MNQSTSKKLNLRQSDTLPSKGRVTEVCKEWLVHEDGALAYKLQKEEVEQHYSGNKTRNAQVREDTPKAKEEQLREERDAFLKYQDMCQQQAEKDEYLALKIAEDLKREEEKSRRKMELHDEEIARKIQEKLSPQSSHKSKSHSAFVNMNKVGLPFSETASFDINSQMGNLALSEGYGEDDPTSLDYRVILNDAELQEEAQRRIQEQKDEELARLLQEQDSGSLTLEERDRMIAMEVQDKELARLLQEKEKMRLRRAREKAKQKALLKKQMQDQQMGEESGQSNQEGERQSRIHEAVGHSRMQDTVGHSRMQDTVGHSRMQDSIGHSRMQDTIGHSRMQDTVGHSRMQDTIGHSRMQDTIGHSRMHDQTLDEPEVEYLSPEEESGNSEQNQPDVCCSTSNNIAASIDPTFSSMPRYNCDSDKYIAPPYMPIQGQRRTSSLDKKSRKKDGCKNQ